MSDGISMGDLRLILESEISMVMATKMTMALSIVSMARAQMPVSIGIELSNSRLHMSYGTECEAQAAAEKIMGFIAECAKHSAEKPDGAIVRNGKVLVFDRGGRSCQDDAHGMGI